MLKCAVCGVCALVSVQQRCSPAIAEPLVPSIWKVSRSSRRTRVAHDERIVPVAPLSSSTMVEAVSSTSTA